VKSDAPAPAADASDAVRSARPLRHALFFRSAEPLELELGGTLAELVVCYETYGKLDETASNAVLVCHALSGDSHVACHDAEDDPGWWDIAVGPGKPIDTDRLFVVCPNVLGGCRGTTGPNSADPATGRPYGASFPPVTIRDMVELQRRLLDHLGVRVLLAVVGGSMGGQMALSWASTFPDRLRGCVAVATAARLTSQGLAFDVVGRNAILRDPHYHGGDYYGRPKGPDVGLALARMIGHITYLSRESMALKFGGDRLSPRDVKTAFEKRFSVGSYLGYQGDRFVERFDAGSYVALTFAMDLFDLGDSVEELSRTIGKSPCRWLVMSYTSDWLFPSEQSRKLVNALVASGRRVSYCNVPSRYGHDSFLLEHDLAVYGELLRGFLANLLACPDPDGPCAAALHRRPAREDARLGVPGPAPEPASIFHGSRLDYDSITSLLEPRSSVLDLGCGHGELLSRLRDLGFRKLVGVELDERAVVSCVLAGLDAIHADLNRELGTFRDSSYDYVVLSRTLQAVLDVRGLLDEIVRIGRHAVVSFPNFAYRKLRRMLAEEGRAPESPGVLSHKWYDTPNLRFFTIADFEELCRERGIRVSRRVFLDTEAGREVREDPNLNADLAIFVLSR
jgi:homoserine O-acetyltransferase/O-succinyltransferase